MSVVPGEGRQSPEAISIGSDTESDTSERLAKDAIVLPWWIGANTTERLRTFLDYEGVGPRKSLISLPRLPSWGFHDKTAYLCEDGRPIQLWVVGILDSMSFFASTAHSNPGTAIAISLLRDLDRDALAAVKSMGKPPTPPFDNMFRASKAGYGINNSIQLFTEVYDATEAYGSKLSMKQIPASSLVAGDVVLAEVKVVRYELGPHKNQGRWTSWRIDFELQSISRLVARPVVKIEREDDGFEEVM
ncbi:hypothetical protein FKP32DRAFT_1606291 [Trametes sanguinea]|nr:hypothetical protein FKP32DRAFT_1606291 [Trametes sanguinea]